ncbi:hypothetical protein ACET3Z_018604 [Daucus carota]
MSHQLDREGFSSTINYSNADAREVSLAEALKMHLTKSKEARTVRDWESVEEEIHLAISSGVDSSPQIYALKAEASLNLGKHQEAYTIIQKGPNDTNLCIQFLGATGCSDLLTTKAQVYMAAGRFEEAVAAAQCAAKLDPTEEAKATAERALALPSARSEGNQLFKASRFSDALKVKLFEIRVQRSDEPGSRGLHSKGFGKALRRRLELQSWSPQFGELHKSCTLLAYMQYHQLVERGYTPLKGRFQL